MQLGMIGLGRMGANMVRRLIQGGSRMRRIRHEPESVKNSPAKARRAPIPWMISSSKLKAPPSRLADGSSRRGGHTLGQLAAIA